MKRTKKKQDPIASNTLFALVEVAKRLTAYSYDAKGNWRGLVFLPALREYTDQIKAITEHMDGKNSEKGTTAKISPAKPGRWLPINYYS